MSIFLASHPTCISSDLLPKNYDLMWMIEKHIEKYTVEKNLNAAFELIKHFLTYKNQNQLELLEIFFSISWSYICPWHFIHDSLAQSFHSKLSSAILLVHPHQLNIPNTLELFPLISLLHNMCTAPFYENICSWWYRFTLLLTQNVPFNHT